MLAHPIEQGLHHFLDGRPEPEHTGKHAKHGKEEQGQAEDVVHQHLVQRVGQARRQGQRYIHRTLQDGAGPLGQGIVLGQTGSQGLRRFPGF